MLIAMLITGCSPKVDNAKTSRNVVILRAAALSDFYGLALYQGVLTKNGNCLTINKLAIVWPADSKAEVLPNGKLAISSKWSGASVKEGDTIAISGSYLTADQAEKLSASWTGGKVTGCIAPYVSGKFSLFAS